MRSIDHVQLAMPTGGEEAARAFFIGVLGMAEEVDSTTFERRPIQMRRGEALLSGF
jgi:hypothetical protein